MLEINDELVDGAFGEERSEKAMAFLKDMTGKIAAVVDEKVADKLMECGLKPTQSASRPGDRQVAVLHDIFKNNGLCRKDGARWTVEDFQAVDRDLVNKIKEGKVKREDYADWQTMSEQPLMFPRVITQELKEAIEPELNLLPLFQRVQWQWGQHGVFQAVSAMNAGNLEVGEATEYAEGKLQFGGQVAFTIGKHGIKISMTDEAIRYNQFDIWSMHIRAAGRALARWKEGQAVKKVLSQGTVFIDNGDAGARHTTGRDDTGSFNGTFTVWDLFDMAADMIQEGYVPNTIIIHPFAWPIFALDPVMRAMGFMHNGKILSGYQGTPGAFTGAPGGLLQNRQANEPANIATTFAPIPSQYPFGPMRIVVSPHIEYDRVANTTTIYICDSRDLGLYLEEAPIQTEEWTVPEKDCRNMKFMERYTFASSNRGRAIRQAKKVVIARSYHFEGGMLSADVTLDTSVFTVS